MSFNRPTRLMFVFGLVLLGLAPLPAPAQPKPLLTLKGHTDVVSTVAVSTDGKRIVSGSCDGIVKVWDAETGKEIHSLKAQDTVYGVAFSPDGKRILSGGGVDSPKEKTPPLGIVKLWDAENGKEILSFEAHHDYVSGVAFSPDGKRILTGSEDHTLKLWNAENGKEILTLKGHSAGVDTVAFSPDGKRIAASSPSGKLQLRVIGADIKVWDAEKGKELFGIEGGVGVAFSPNGKRLATGAIWFNKEVKIRDAENGKEILSIGGDFKEPIGELFGHRATCVVFSPDGTKLLTSSYESERIRLWDAETGKPLLNFQAHDDGIRCVTFGPDGKRIISASHDKTIKIWDIDALPKIPRTLEGHTEQLTNVSFSPDGKRIVSSSYDKTAKVWDADQCKEILTLRGHTEGS
jgi:eukaryotic-like serine/threonine-protein kinase